MCEEGLINIVERKFGTVMWFLEEVCVLRLSTH
jgi:hypothetical protein